MPDAPGALSSEPELETTEQDLSLLADPSTILKTLIVVGALIVAIYFLLPRLIGFDDALAKLGEGDRLWIAAALAFNVGAFFAYIALFRGVVGESVLHLEWRESYQITMAGLAATRLFSAGGAGGIILTYWALRKAGMRRRRAANRMVAFLVLLYAVYMFALVIGGVLLRIGVLPGNNPVGLTIVPAALAGTVMAVFLLLALVPGDLERRLGHLAGSEHLVGRLAHRIASVPATVSTGTRLAIGFVRSPSRGGLALSGAVGFWAANVAVLWASFHAFDASVPIGVVVVGFFIGMTANLFPFAPGGVGAVDAGMIGAFVLFGLPSSEVFAAVLTYRLIAFWFPIPPGVLAFFQLRQTTRRWERERATVEDTEAEERDGALL